MDIKFELLSKKELVSRLKSGEGIGADLTCADFSNMNLKGISFERADLRNAIFRGANLKNVNFKEADLRDADFRSQESASFGNVAEKSKDHVILSTIHSAKGLEFDVVFLIGAIDGVMPSAKAITELEQEEEKRVFYVGITRAKSKLLLTAFPRELQYDALMPSLAISRYLTLPNIKKLFKTISAHKKDSDYALS